MAIQFVTYEYKVMESMRGSYVDEDELNDLGNDGWELVTVNGSDFIFKRPSGMMEVLSEEEIDERDAELEAEAKAAEQAKADAEREAAKQATKRRKR